MTSKRPKPRETQNDPTSARSVDLSAFLSNSEPQLQVKKTRWLQGCFLPLLFIILAAAGLVWLALNSAQQIPPFYAKALDTPLEDAITDGDQLEIQITRVQNAARKKQPWSVEFTQEQVNGWLVADLPNKFPSVLPRKIKDPRVHFEPRLGKLAFQYSANGIHGIVVGEFDIFCTDQQNELAIQIKSVKSGFVSLPVGPWMERLTDSADQAGIPILWSNREGEPVALVTIPNELLDFQDRQIVVIEAVEIKSGKILIAGTTSQLETSDGD